MSKKNRFAKRGKRNKTGIGSELNEVLKERAEGDEEIDKNIEIGLQNKDINEPFNQEAVQEDFKAAQKNFPTRTRYASRKPSTEELPSSNLYQLKSSPNQIKSSRHTSSNEPPPPAIESSEEESEDELPLENVAIQSCDEDRISDLLDQIEELELKLQEKDIIIKQKDNEIRRLQRGHTSSSTTATRSRRAHAGHVSTTYQPRQSDF